MGARRALDFTAASTRPLLTYGQPYLDLTLTFFPAAHAVADSYEAMQALIAGAISEDGPPASFLLPTRQPGLLRWALDAGLRIVKPMNYMVTGRHAQPLGAWIPSVLY